MALARHFQVVPCWRLLFWFKGWTWLDHQSSFYLSKIPSVCIHNTSGLQNEHCMMDKPDDEHPRTKVEQSPKVQELLLHANR